MNILILNWRDLKHSWAGGGEIYIFEQAKRWVKMGHSVTLFCGNDVEKILWIVIIVLAGWLGALVYLIVIRSSNPRGLAK